MVKLPKTQLFASKLLIFVTTVDLASDPEVDGALFGEVVATEGRLVFSQILKF